LPAAPWARITIKRYPQRLIDEALCVARVDRVLEAVMPASG
jgi:hypothetical protein